MRNSFENYLITEIRVDNVFETVFGTIIDDDDLIIRICLTNNRFYRPDRYICPVPDGHDYTEHTGSPGIHNNQIQN